MKINNFEVLFQETFLKKNREIKNERGTEGNRREGGEERKAEGKKEGRTRQTSESNNKMHFYHYQSSFSR